MSFNIRWENEEETVNAWDIRKEYVASMIRFHNMDLVGLQEPLLNQLYDLEALLPEFSWFGMGMENGNKEGHYDDAILY